jgi:hypothetical protein
MKKANQKEPETEQVVEDISIHLFTVYLNMPSVAQIT